MPRRRRLRLLVPRVLAANNIVQGAIRFPEQTIERIIDGYTSESGVRLLEKTLSKIVRKVVLENMRGGAMPEVIEPSALEHYLGRPTRIADRYEGNDIPGVVTGLAWTAAGGEILFIEAASVPGKDAKLSLTGNLGDVMKESATLALQYVRAHAVDLGVSPELLENNAIHVHVPAGAIPKDGPSAGITMATSIVSAFTGKRVRERLAMTGEITLRGKVLPVGGIKEKILAAKRAGINDIVLSEENRRDVEDINERYRKGLTFHYVNTVLDVIKYSVTD